jgi:hypothetical protein
MMNSLLWQMVLQTSISITLLGNTKHSAWTQHMYIGELGSDLAGII